MKKYDFFALQRGGGLPHYYKLFVKRRSGGQKN